MRWAKSRSRLEIGGVRKSFLKASLEVCCQIKLTSSQYRALALSIIFLPQALFGGVAEIKQGVGGNFGAGGNSSDRPIGIPDELAKEIEEVIKACYRDLDYIQKSVDEWGHASFSDLVFLPDARNRSEGAAKPFQLYTNVGQDTGSSYQNLLDEVVNPQGGAAFLDQASTGIAFKGRFGQDSILGNTQELQMAKTDVAQQRLEDAVQLEEINQKIRELNALELLNQQKYLVERAEKSRENKTMKDDIKVLPLENAGASAALLPPAIGTGVELPDLTTTDEATERPQTTPGHSADEDYVNKSSISNPVGNVPFSNDLKLFQKNSFQISPAQAITLAASAKTKENLLAFLADPLGQGIISANQVLYLGVGTVSVSPGTRTARDYICEVQARPSYRCKDPTNAVQGQGPSVISAYPFAEGQVLDLQYSKQRQFQFMMDLAAAYAGAGNTAGAQLMFNHVKRMQKDVATESFAPAVIPSSDGTQLTYRFDPSLFAIGRPSVWKSGPEDRLQPVNIPILVLMACEKSEIVEHSEVGFDVNVRWIPKESRHWAQKLAVDWWKRGKVVDKRFDANINFERAKAADRILMRINWLASALKWTAGKANVSAIIKGQSTVYSWETNHLHFWRNQLKELKTRFKTFEFLALSVERWKELPLPLPGITQVALFQKPDSPDPQKTYLGIHGLGFKLGTRNLVREVSLRGRQFPLNGLLPESEGYLEIPVDANLEKWLKDQTNTSLVEVVTLGGRAKYESINGRFLNPAAPIPQILGVSPAIVKKGEEKLSLVVKVDHFTSKEMAEITKSAWNVYVGNTKAEVDNFTPDYRSLFINLVRAGGFPEGKHEVNVWVENTKKVATLADGLTVNATGTAAPATGGKETAAKDVKLELVWPKRGYVRASTVVIVSGSGFLGGGQQNVIEQVLVEGRQCRFRAISDKLLEVIIPPWSDGELKNFHTEKEGAELCVVVTGHKPFIKSNAIRFDLDQPGKEMVPTTSLQEDETKIHLELIRTKLKELEAQLPEPAKPSTAAKK
jgi:hypothetical protein